MKKLLLACKGILNSWIIISNVSGANLKQLAFNKLKDEVNLLWLVPRKLQIFAGQSCSSLVVTSYHRFVEFNLGNNEMELPSSDFYAWHIFPFYIIFLTNDSFIKG